MKFLVAFALLFGAAHAEAVTLNCRTYSGDVAYVSLANNQAQVSWAARRMPNSPILRFNGNGYNSAYYRSLDWMLEVQRSVFQTGVGKMWLQYPTEWSQRDRSGRRDRDDGPPARRRVALNCR